MTGEGKDEALVLAIDAGGTAVKVALIDAAGCIHRQNHAAVETIHHPDGRVERDGLAFWQATAQAIRHLVQDVAPERLRAVGCTGFGNGIFMVDAQGLPTLAGIVSVDHRGQPLADAVLADGRAEAISAVNGHRPWGGQAVIQLAHLAATRPEVMARSAWGLSCKDFIRFQLTGEALTDPTDASGGGLMALARGDYAQEVFALLGQPDLAGKLPPIRSNSALAGRISAKAAVETGLPEGLPVAGGMMDVAACVIGAGVTDPGRMVMIAGTWAINGIEVGAPTPGAPVPILDMIHRDGAARLVAEGSPSSAANLGWYLSRATGGRLQPAEAVALAGTVAPGARRRCQFLPYVHGPSPREGAFVGLTATDSEATMIRAICEGVAFQHRRHAEELLPQTGRGWPDAIRLAGGAARSSVWAQIFADVCQRPVEVVAAEEVGALGAAICAAVAGGLHADLQKATQAMSRVDRVHAPDPAAAGLYDQRYAEFQRLDRGMIELLSGRS